MADLKDSETRLAPYDKLSRGTKQRMDLERRSALTKAREDNKAPFGEAAIEAATAMHPLLPQRLKDEDAAAYAERQRSRAAKIKYAEDAADYKDVKDGVLFGDDQVHKLPGYKKGGMVKALRRGWGKARGA